MKRFQYFILLLFFSILACADELEAMKVRKMVEIDPSTRAAFVEKYILPVSEGISQKSTELCWAFATLNVLETNFLYRNPKATIQLSREFLQYLTWKDRYIRYIQGIREFLSDRGNAIDAIKLIEEHGLMSAKYYPAPLKKFPSIKKLIDQQNTIHEKMNFMQNKLNTFYGKPKYVFSNNKQEHNRKEFAYKILGTKLWKTYGVKTGKLGIGDHPDPDARKESTVEYITREELPEKIKQSLKNGYAMTVGLGGHIVMLYGAEYDEKGNATTYYIKDSYPNYFYQASASKIEEQTWGITTVELD